GDTVGCGALPIDVHRKVRRAVVIVRAKRGEAFEVEKRHQQLIGVRVNVIRNNSANSKGVLALRLIGRTDVNLQNGARRDNRGQSRNGADRFLQSQQTLLDRIALRARFEYAKDNSLRRCAPRSGSGVREKLRNARLRHELLIHLFLKRAHLSWRGTFLGDENPAGKPAVSNWKQRERQMSKEKEKADDTDEQDRHRQVGAVEKPVERATVPVDHALNEIASPLFHSGAFMARASLTENARTHQRGER